MRLSPYPFLNKSRSAPVHEVLEAKIYGVYRVGVFSTLTNAYALVAIGASENFYRYGPAAPRYPRRESVRSVGYGNCRHGIAEADYRDTVHSKQSYKM